MNLLEEIRQVERDAELIYSMDQLESAIERIAAEINARLGGSNPILLTVLNGGIIFSGKLLPRLRFLLQIDAVKASRYRGEGIIDANSPPQPSPLLSLGRRRCGKPRRRLGRNRPQASLLSPFLLLPAVHPQPLPFPQEGRQRQKPAQGDV